ncbi:hypothetical protein BGZ97_004575, partial [Linnemannia gamsii]
MATNTLTLFCLINGDPTSNAFSVKIPSSDTVDDLKNLIKTTQSPDFNDIAAKNLTLWRVTIPVVAGKIHEAVFLNEIDAKTELVAIDEISELFKKKTLPKKSIHIIIERSKGTPHTLELEALRQEIEDLRGGKSIVVLNVVLRPNRSE